MMFVYLMLGTTSFALSQTVTIRDGPSPTISSITTHTIDAGAAGYVYSPNTLSANVGDVVEFRFYPQNHSVGRAGYEHPCIPYEYSGLNKIGFWSGFQPVNVVLQNPPTFNILINDTDPIFFYCSAPGACIEKGMIGVINPINNETLETQLAFAKNSTIMFSPGEAFPAETTSPSSMNTSMSVDEPPTHATVPAGSIAGIVIGGLVLLGIIIWFCFVHKRKTHTTPSRVQFNSAANATPLFAPPPEYFQPPLSPNLPSDTGELFPAPHVQFGSPQDRPLSPLISPDRSGRFPFDSTEFPMTRGLSPTETLTEPQELPVPESLISSTGNGAPTRPFSFEVPPETDRTSAIRKLSHM